MNLEQSNPLVTVYIPTFNRVELLKRAVESVRQQTYQNLEIIVVDDCSTDGTHEYLKDISNKDSRIRFFLKEKNSGACVSRNIAIKNANGEYITGLDDDDYFFNTRVSNFIDNKEKLKEYKFLCSKYYFKSQKEEKSKIEIFKPSVIKAKDLLTINYVGNQIFCKTLVLKEVLFNENLEAWQDLYTWYQLLDQDNSKAFIINSYTYVVDFSHEHERISKKSLIRFEKVFDCFSKDFKLNNYHKDILSCQLINYGKSNVSRRVMLFSFLNSLNLYSFIVLLLRFFKK